MALQLERRRHRRFVTHNTEYHLRDDLCVAVRCRSTSAWIEDHPALGTILAGGLKRTPYGYARGEASEGTCLWFDAGGVDLVTSKVQDENRPEVDAVMHYLRKEPPPPEYVN